MIPKNIDLIRERMRNACARAGRPEDSVRLLLATKTVDPERIRTAFEHGETLIGENRVQEVKQKFPFLQDIPHEQHFIGHLQTNKIKDILKYDIRCIQSLDRLSLAEKLHEQLSRQGKTIEALIQVNTSAEESKFGLQPEEVIGFARQLVPFGAVKVKGLMTIGLFSAEEAKVRTCFRLLRSVRDELQQAGIPGIELKELSMGMSGDLEIAIEEGATIIRVGTAIFGHRIYPDSYYWNENKKTD